MIRLAAAALATLLLIACSETTPPATTPTSVPPSAPQTAAPVAQPATTLPPGLVQARVTRVVDGDTFEVDRALDGRATVRLIGIDTPETVAPGQPVDCYGREASAKTKELVEGKTVLS